MRVSLMVPLGAGQIASVLWRVGWAVVLFIAVEGAYAASCVRLQGTELPRLGAIRGAWLGEGQFVLVDLKRNRLLVYDVPGRSVRSVRSAPGASWLAGVSADLSEPVALAQVGAGLLLGVHTPPSPGASASAHLVLLDIELRPSSTFSWPLDATAVEGRAEYVGDIREIVVADDGVWLWARRGGRYVLLEMGLERSVRSDYILRERAEWPTLEGEYPFLSHLPVRSLATTRGDDSGAHAYALRFSKTPFIQILGNSGIEELQSFPRVATRLPGLPRVDGWGSADAFYTAAELASYPAGLYGELGHLYVLTRSVRDGEVNWHLHRLDPEVDAVVGRSKLPTNAAHVTLLAGKEHWVLEESSSFAEDLFRQPTGLLLLDSEAIRAGKPLACE